ncbi:MAG: hypothetical protein M1419_09495 [Bacteroidetes bacterium]|nr:hypothetical protein [Bacteroidota bacterium]
MKKINEYLIILIISFLGIGFIPYVSGILTLILSSLIIFLPIANKEYFILCCAIILMLIYIPANKIFVGRMKGKEKNNVMPKAIGELLTLSSPVIVYSIGWILTSIFVFIVFSHSSTAFDGYLKRRTKGWSVLIKDLTAGMVTVIVLHVLYAGWLISPYVLAFLGK